MSPEQPALTRTDALHRQVARNIRNDIEAGVLRDGEVLPSTRELATKWGVSGFTISEAMKLLVDEGLVVTVDRSKRVVKAPADLVRKELRPRDPIVVYIGGYAGSGKSELSRILVRETGWPLLDKDTLTRPVVEAALEVMGRSPNDRESDEYLTRVRPREYEALAATTTENVACGNSAIVTAPFIREFNDAAWLDRTIAANAAMKATTVIVWMSCDVDTMHTYIRHRGAARDAAKLADWPTYAAGVDTGFRPAAPHVVVVDNSASARPLQVQGLELLQTLLNGVRT